MKDPFPSTHWSEILVRSSDDGAAEQAWQHLYERYRPPLYAYLRRRGHEIQEAEDLLQGFFTHLLDHDVARRLEGTGRLRAFLLQSLKNFVASERLRAAALKRTPPEGLVRIDTSGEERILDLGAKDRTPEQWYEHRWALTTMQHAIELLVERESQRTPRRELELLLPHVTGGSEALPYREIAARSDRTESALKVQVHRMRKRLGEILREELASTVGARSSVDDEVRFLLRVVS